MEGYEQSIFTPHGYLVHLSLCAALSQFEADSTMHEACIQKPASQIILQSVKLVHHVYLVKQNLHRKLLFYCINKEQFSNMALLAPER